MQIVTALLPLLLLGCGPQQEETSQQKWLFDNSPTVDFMVLPNQDQQLSGLTSETLASSFDTVVGFGDSLSDTGNLNRNTFGIFINKSATGKVAGPMVLSGLNIYPSL